MHVTATFSMSTTMLMGLGNNDVIESAEVTARSRCFGIEATVTG
ncbi:hypothetical protein [Streptodolium elevatio]